MKNSKDYSNSLLSSADAIVLILNTDGIIEYFNPFMEEVSGYQLSEVKDKDWFDIFLPENLRDHIRVVFKNTINDIQTSGTINPILTRSGDEKQIEWFNQALKDEDGSPYGVLVIGHEITKRKEIELRLELQAKAINQINDSIISTDLDGYITTWNNAAEKQLGYSTEDIIGKHISTIYPDDEHEFLQNEVISPLIKKGVHEIEVRLRRNTGKDFLHIFLYLYFMIKTVIQMA